MGNHGGWVCDCRYALIYGPQCLRCGRHRPEAIPPRRCEVESEGPITIDAQLDELLNIGTGISAKSHDRGMASVKLLWNPYECQWEASCSWSDNSELKASKEKASDALVELRDLLRKARDQ